MAAVHDMSAVVNVLRYYAGWADKVVGQTIPSGKLDFCILITHVIHLKFSSIQAIV
jgi:hypothetical protein